MQDVNQKIAFAFKTLAKADVFSGYNEVKNRYNNVDRFSILHARAVNDFKKENNKNIKLELQGVIQDKEDLEKEIDEKQTDLKLKLDDIDKKLMVAKEDAGFIYLYSGFNKYGKRIKNKLILLFIEKILWVVSMIFTIGLAAYLRVLYDWDILFLTPFAAVTLLFFLLLKVNLKKADQFEQIRSKIEHKLAVSAFYQSEMEGLKDSNKKELDMEYYRFIFSNIETTEWNTPDVVSDIATILKSYKK